MFLIMLINALYQNCKNGSWSAVIARLWWGCVDMQVSLEPWLLAGQWTWWIPISCAGLVCYVYIWTDKFYLVFLYTYKVKFRKPQRLHNILPINRKYMGNVASDLGPNYQQRTLAVWVKVFRNNPEFRILRLTFLRKGEHWAFCNTFDFH